MPEGPEINTVSLFINSVCKKITFTGSPRRSSVSKNPEVDFDSNEYTIRSESRGKELALFLTCQHDPANQTRLLFRFGMSGRFNLTPASELYKHSHLIFTSTEEPPRALSFVDARRFGSWRVCDSWGSGRGPDPMYEHDLFAANITNNLTNDVFNKPICEVMLNQQFFNGIGNYLRAEILYRASVPPFVSAREALSTSNVISLCQSVPLEVVHLKVGLDKKWDLAVSDEDYLAFKSWLQCYEKPEMTNVVDHNKRTIWFKGEPGPLVPRVMKSRNVKRSRKIHDRSNDDGKDDKETKKMKKCVTIESHYFTRSKSKRLLK